MIENPVSAHENPSADVSNPLVTHIANEIETQGAITFARFMELALYTPGLGYYTSSLQKMGKGGDFTTAPEISSLYSKCIAKQCQQVLAFYGGDILELGAGSGKLAAEILLELEKKQNLPAHYFILEVSADLRQRQQAYIKQHAPHLSDRVIWLDTLNNFSMSGVILANEVMDAFPVHCFQWRDKKLQERFITWQHDQFASFFQDPTESLENYIQSLNVTFPEHYQSEANLYISGWIKALNQVLSRGLILLIDYGFPRSEYYHPDRKQGTLMCHFRHQAHTNPLINVGLQDITAHVDFTTVAEAAASCQLEIAGFTNQANFLLSSGLIEELQKQPEDVYYKMANETKILMSPNEMGELFKAMALTKKIDLSLIGFLSRNAIERL